MLPLVIVPSLYIFKYGNLSLFSCCEFLSVNQFSLYRFKKAFSNSIIPAITFTAHALNNILVYL